MLALALFLACCTAGTAGQTVWIDVRDADVSDVVALLAAQTGHNIVFEGQNPVRVSLHLADVALGEALEIIAQSTGMHLHSRGDVWILSSTLDPGQTTVAYGLRYLRPDDAVTDLKAMRPEGTYLADKDQNQILVSGGDVVQSAARAALATLDRASPQVMFEVKVADVTPINDDTNFGLEFGGFDLQGQPAPGSVTYAFTGKAIPWYVRLNAMVSQGRAEVLATPRLMTVNGREADLLIGQSYPIVYNASVFGGQNVQFVDIGVKLRVTPTIGADGSVTAELHPEYSELLGQTSTGYPIVANRKIDATLRVRSDQTIVLGGLMRDANNDLIEKIPGLGDLPVIGKFFQNRIAHRERDEIVFLITPHVVYPNQAVPQK